MKAVLFPKLIVARCNPYAEPDDGAQGMIMEQNRTNLFREVPLFLDEAQMLVK